MFIRFFIFIFLASASLFAEEQPLTIVIFGGTGDLAARKVIPALSHLAEGKALPERFAVVGVGRREYTHEDFRALFKGMPPEFQIRLFYSQVDFEKGQGYEEFAQFLASLDQDFEAKSNRIYFLSTQASFFAPIIEKLGVHGLISNSSKVMIEKPFGSDLESAVELQESLAQTLDESQVYRIDHYLGKEGVQNLLDFRLKGELDPIWNHQHIDHVQITVSEKMGIESRARFWEETGLLRDVVQNHLLQILSILAADFETLDLPSEKAKLLSAIRQVRKEEIVRGQYSSGGGHLGYREEAGVPLSSSIETFAAVKLWIDNERWRGVPFYIRAGKRLPAQGVEVAVYFKNDVKRPLVIRIQPKPAIFWQGQIFSFSHQKWDAYETLFLDCIRSEKSRFVSKEEQLIAWSLLSPLLSSSSEVFHYQAGSWGPQEAEELLMKDGREWKDPVP